MRLCRGCSLYIEYQVDPLALLVLFFFVVHYHGHMHSPGYNCSNVCIVSKELPVVTRTHVGGHLCPGDLLAGTEWVVLALSVEETRGYMGTYCACFNVLSRLCYR